VLGGGFPASWTPDAGVTTAASGLYTVVTDGSATIAGRLMRTVANAGSNTYVAGVVIKKDAVAKATRYVRVMLRGSSTTYSIDLDTSTGETVAVSGATGGALDLGDEWYVYVTGLIVNGVDTIVGIAVYPAFGANANLLTTNNATTG